MIIKHSESSIAIEKLYDLLTFVQERFNNCIGNGHRSTLVIYISSLLISPNTVYKGKRLIDFIEDIVKFSVKDCICVVRTTSPNFFPPPIKNIQSSSIKKLDKTAYVVRFDHRRQFLNHAKFLLFYHVCFSEKMAYHGKFFGSTNMTGAGLANYGKYRVGNYEEFSVSGPKAKMRLSVRHDLFYLNEVKDLIMHRGSLYINSVYLQRFLMKHLETIRDIIDWMNRVVSSTTMADLYEAYVTALTSYCSFLALLDEIPGKQLTEDFVENLHRFELSYNIFELETLLPLEEDRSMWGFKELQVSEEELRKRVDLYITVIKDTYYFLQERYLPAVNRIRQYVTEEERLFLFYLEQNFDTHLKRIGELIGMCGSNLRKLND